MRGSQRFNRPQTAVVLGGILYSARQGAIKHEDSQRFMGMITGYILVQRIISVRQGRFCNAVGF